MLFTLFAAGWGALASALVSAFWTATITTPNRVGMVLAGLVIVALGLVTLGGLGYRLLVLTKDIL